MKNFNYLLISGLLLGTSLNANEDFLSQTKKEILNYLHDKSIQDSNKLKRDWINPVTYKYIYNDGEKYTTQKSFITISQPIFKSGGIFHAIKYANAIKKYSKTSIDTQKKELIKQTINLLFQIKKIDISINKQKLLIKNAKLDIQRKREQVLNGILDTSFLDNAILDSNTKQNSLIDLKYQKLTFINNLANLCDKKYNELELPTLSIISDKKFLDENIYIKKASQDIDSSYWMKKMVATNYLPTVNFTADYAKYHNTDDNPAISTSGNKNIGFNITIPFDIKSSYNIESSKLEYLQKKATLKDKKQEELTIFKNAIAKIASLDKKIQIAISDVNLYNSLLTQMREQLEVGMKTITDVETLVNSKDIKALDIKSLDIEKQIELLEIYSRINNG